MRKIIHNWIWFSKYSYSELVRHYTCKHCASLVGLIAGQISSGSSLTSLLPAFTLSIAHFASSWFIWTLTSSPSRRSWCPLQLVGGDVLRNSFSWLEASPRCLRQLDDWGLGELSFEHLQQPSRWAWSTSFCTLEESIVFAFHECVSYRDPHLFVTRFRFLRLPICLYFLSGVSFEICRFGLNARLNLASGAPHHCSISTADIQGQDSDSAASVNRFSIAHLRATWSWSHLFLIYKSSLYYI